MLNLKRIVLLCSIVFMPSIVSAGCDHIPPDPTPYPYPQPQPAQPQQQDPTQPQQPSK